MDEPVSSIIFSLDGKENVSISGNSTINALSNGVHNVTVYARDAAGNFGATETINFSVAVPFPVVPIAVVLGASVAIAAVGLIYYFKKRKT